MKSVIKQKLNLNLDSNQMFSVVLTKGIKTYQLNFKNRENAMEYFLKCIFEEGKFSQLIGRKSTIGLYRKHENGELYCIRQLLLNGFSL